MIAQGIDSIPSIEKVKPLAMEKVCPACGKDLPPTAVTCDNTSCPNPSAVATMSSRPKPRTPDQKGSGGARIQQHETIVNNRPVSRMYVPGTPIAAQSTLPMSKVPTTAPSQPVAPAVNPIKKKRQMISDDDVQVVDHQHLSNIEHSADHLGL